jgi:hypothetical protein
MYKIILIIICLLCIYSSFYYIFPEEITIYQTDLDHFDYNILYKKQLIIIEDDIQNMNTVLSIFNTNIINENVNIHNLWNKNRYKYLLIQSKGISEITLSHPYDKYIDGVTPTQESSLTTIKLKNNKILIIPFNWRYHIDNNNVNTYAIHDYITYILYLL